METFNKLKPSLFHHYEYSSVQFERETKLRFEKDEADGIKNNMLKLNTRTDNFMFSHSVKKMPINLFIDVSTNGILVCWNRATCG